MIDTAFLKILTEVPSVGTACGPIISALTGRFGGDYARTLVPDGFCLFQKAGAAPESLRVVFVAHLDEIGGCVYGERTVGDSGGYDARYWGNTPDVFANATLQAFDYLAENGDGAFPVRAEVGSGAEDARLIVRGEGIRPYRTVWTFREETTFEGDTIEGKALDPRVTVYAVMEAVRALNRADVGALFVMAEECAMDMARKAITFLQRRSPDLQLLVNADVPSTHNLGEGRCDLPAIRIYEGRGFIDPSFGIRAAEAMERQGVEFHLSGARSISQTILFTPLAPTLSIALPSDGIHLPRYQMSLTGTERCIALLRALGESALRGDFA